LLLQRLAVQLQRLFIHLLIISPVALLNF